MFFDTAAVWRQRAICRDEDPELFFPISSPGSRHYKAQEAEAKAVCRRCPVRAECLADALTVPAGKDQFAIVGGTNPDERAALRRTADRQPIPA